MDDLGVLCTRSVIRHVLDAAQLQAGRQWIDATRLQIKLGLRANQRRAPFPDLISPLALALAENTVIAFGSFASRRLFALELGGAVGIRLGDPTKQLDSARKLDALALHDELDDIASHLADCADETFSVTFERGGIAGGRIRRVQRTRPDEFLAMSAQFHIPTSDLVDRIARF